MQMVAAAKLRRAQEAAEAARPYAERMDAVLANLARGVASPDGASQLLVGTGKDDTHLLVMMTAERGLCGGFNTNIAKLVRTDATRLISEGKKVKILAVGRKGADNLKRDLGEYITDRVSLAGIKTLGFDKASEIADQVMGDFAEGGYDVCTIYFSEFESVISQKPTALQLIPASLPEGDADEAVGESIVYDYEPEENEIPRLSSAPQHLDANLPRSA